MAIQSAAPSRRRIMRWLLPAVPLMLLGLAMWAWLPQRLGRKTAGAVEPIAILAVLPLRAESEADSALAEGLTDELTAALARLPRLFVIGPTSTRISAAKYAEATAAARALGADHVLDGQLHSDGAQLRLSLQLLQTSSGRARWKQDYSRHLGRFPTLEREVLQAVAGVLSLPELPAAKSPAGVDAGHFRRYLEARNLLREGPERAAQAVASFRALVTEAPRDARAHEGLADALYDRGLGTYEDVRVLREEARVEASRALELDPGLGNPHGVLADSPCRETRWTECLGLLQRAIELSPSVTHWRSLYAWRLATLGYLRQAREQLDLALALDPFDTRTHYMIATVLDALGDHDAALGHVDRQDSGSVNITRWFNAIWRHDFDRAMRVAQSYGSERWRPSMVAVTAAMQDTTLWPAARAAVEASMRPDGRWTFYAMLLPEPDVASNILGFENTLRSGNSAITNYLWAPEIASHRRGAEFQSYLRRNHILDYWREHGWPDGCKAAGEGAWCD